MLTESSLFTIQDAIVYLIHADGSPITVACRIVRMSRKQALSLGRYSGFGYCHVCGQYVKRMT